MYFGFWWSSKSVINKLSFDAVVIKKYVIIIILNILNGYIRLPGNQNMSYSFHEIKIVT